MSNGSDSRRRKILLLHGSRQSGQLLLGRVAKLRKQLEKQNLDLVAPDAPFIHPDDEQMRQWWKLRAHENVCEGLETETLELILSTWNGGDEFVGMIGFSQGARLVHLLLLCHQVDPGKYFPGVRFGILVAGYDAPIPVNFIDAIPSLAEKTTKLSNPSTLHVFGLADKLISPEQSLALASSYTNGKIHEHEGGHHVPMRAANVRVYVDFITDSLKDDSGENERPDDAALESAKSPIKPDDETMETQKDEVEAIEAIFPEEFTMLSNIFEDGDFEHPIRYQVLLNGEEKVGWWPPHDVTVQYTYPHDYPQFSIPEISLSHSNNVMEFNSEQKDACLNAMLDACRAEEGMPSVLASVYAARDFFESGVASGLVAKQLDNEPSLEEVGNTETESSEDGFPRSCSQERVRSCIDEGVLIAGNVLREMSIDADDDSRFKGGSYRFTIGLVGKPSAGKSTFFNVATAFARQKGDDDNKIGGATMAPHPFTTIDPNVGYCLAPAPPGSCPEDGYDCDREVGSTHGRDHLGRRLVPVLLKDVAGLVPGAYQGKGRGNKFLNDLTDADVLIHVLDASGTADAGGNAMGVEEDGVPCAGASHPLEDLAWIHNELIEWVYSNLMAKWDVIKRKGRSKLSGMFSGYGQTQAVTDYVLRETDRFVKTKEARETYIEDFGTWDSGDVHRLVSAFLAVRFPMLLALNKKDLPPSAKHISDIQISLPLHGIQHAVPVSARSEMEFMRTAMERSMGDKKDDQEDQTKSPPLGVWNCLERALSIGAPVFVFPVADLTTLAPLPGLAKRAAEDPTLPSHGMIECILSSGGKPPSCWDPQAKNYSSRSGKSCMLRDMLLMKPGSTVEDVFVALKNIGAFGGEFVRAEGMSNINQQPKPVLKLQKVSSRIRILKIMTSKRTAWQKQHSSFA